MPADDGSLHMRLEPAEPLDAGLRRMALEQLEVAAAGFSIPATDDVLGNRIHLARKATKRIRALLRLVRDDVGKDVYRNENAVLRDQARRLSDLRIANVLIDTLDLLASSDGTVPVDAVADLRRELLARRATLIAEFRSDGDGLAAARTALACTRARIASWPGFHDRAPATGTPDPHQVAGAVALIPGFMRVYRQGRRAMKRAQTSPSATAFHEWRKQVNYLRYQIEALQGRLPAGLGELEAPLDELSATLGEEHDLADLVGVIEAVAAPPLSTTDGAVLLAAIEQRRRGLQQTALGSGETIYRERPGRVETELTAHWEAG